MNNAPLRTTGLEGGPASTNSSIESPVGDPMLTTLLRAHRDYFSCSECQQTLLLLSSMTDFDDTLIDVTLAHLAGHWSRWYPAAGTESNVHPTIMRALGPYLEV